MAPSNPNAPNSTGLRLDTGGLLGSMAHPLRSEAHACASPPSRRPAGSGAAICTRTRTLSDGALSPEQVVEAYKRAGYDFVQLSEHFLARFGWPIADTRAFRSNNFTTLIGAELHAMGTEVGELWHILAAGLPLDFPAPKPDETGPAARGAGARRRRFVAIAHPAWSQLTIGDGRALAGAHAVEIYNHGCAVETDRGDGFYLLDQLLNEGRRLTAIATDDAHFKNGDYDAFGGFVEVKAESLDPDALLAALKAGHFYSSQGPRLLDVEVSPGEIAVACSPVHSIALLTGTSRALSQGRPAHHFRHVRHRQRRKTGLGRSGRAEMVPHRRDRRGGPARLDQPDLDRRTRRGLNPERPCAGAVPPINRSLAAKGRREPAI